MGEMKRSLKGRFRERMRRWRPEMEVSRADLRFWLPVSWRSLWALRSRMRTGLVSRRKMKVPRATRAPPMVITKKIQRQPIL